MLVCTYRSTLRLVHWLHDGRYDCHCKTCPSQHIIIIDYQYLYCYVWSCLAYTCTCLQAGRISAILHHPAYQAWFRSEVRFCSSVRLIKIAAVSAESAATAAAAAAARPAGQSVSKEWYHQHQSGTVKFSADTAVNKLTKCSECNHVDAWCHLA